MPFNLYLWLRRFVDDRMKRLSVMIVILILLLAGAICGKAELRTPPESPSSNGTSSTDTIAPSITDISISEVSETTATITWTTDEAATSQVEYGKTTGYGSTTPLDENLVTSHSVTLVGLKPNTTYHFRVKSKDTGGKEAASEDNSFVTLELKLLVTHRGWYDSSYRYYYIEFEAENISSHSVDAFVEKRLYSNGVRTWTSGYSIQDIDPGEVWKLRGSYDERHGVTENSSYEVTLKWVEVSNIPSPVSTTDVVIVGEFPRRIRNYGRNLDVVIENRTGRTISSVQLQVKYYWDDGKLRLSQTWRFGPIDPFEMVDPGIPCLIGSDGVPYTVFILGYS